MVESAWNCKQWLEPHCETFVLLYNIFGDRNESFSGNETLRSHMFRIHSISRMFMCRCCNWAFPDKTSLHIHMQSMLRNGTPGDVSVLARSSTEGPGMAGGTFFLTVLFRQLMEHLLMDVYYSTWNVHWGSVITWRRRNFYSKNSTKRNTLRNEFDINGMETIWINLGYSRCKLSWEFISLYVFCKFVFAICQKFNFWAQMPN